MNEHNISALNRQPTIVVRPRRVEETGLKEYSDDEEKIMVELILKVNELKKIVKDYLNLVYDNEGNGLNVVEKNEW